MHADEVPIPRPCNEDRARMRLDPEGLRRHCDRCDKPVHDLSAMGPEQARALLQASYMRDEDGEIVFSPPSPPAPALEEPCEPKPAPARKGKRKKLELVLIQGELL